MLTPRNGKAQGQARRWRRSAEEPSGPAFSLSVWTDRSRAHSEMSRSDQKFEDHPPSPARGGGPASASVVRWRPGNAFPNIVDRNWKRPPRKFPWKARLKVFVQQQCSAGYRLSSGISRETIEIRPQLPAFQDPGFWPAPWKLNGSFDWHSGVIEQGDRATSHGTRQLWPSASRVGLGALGKDRPRKVDLRD